MEYWFEHPAVELRSLRRDRGYDLLFGGGAAAIVVSGLGTGASMIHSVFVTGADGLQAVILWGIIAVYGIVAVPLCVALSWFFLRCMECLIEDSQKIAKFKRALAELEGVNILV